MVNDDMKLTYIRKPRSADGARPVMFWFLFLVTGLAFGLSVAYTMDPQTARGWRNLSFAAVIATALALVVLAYRMKRHDELQWSEMEYSQPAAPVAPPAPAVPDKREVNIRTARGRMVIVQPRPGAFAAWLADVINPDTKTTFSKNEAKRREWEDWQYINLCAQMKDGGWLHQNRLLNGAPDVDSVYLNEMREWLKTPLL